MGLHLTKCLAPSATSSRRRAPPTGAGPRTGWTRRRRPSTTPRWGQHYLITTAVCCPGESGRSSRPRLRALHLSELLLLVAGVGAPHLQRPRGGDPRHARPPHQRRTRPPRAADGQHHGQDQEINLLPLPQGECVTIRTSA